MLIDELSGTHVAVLDDRPLEVESLLKGLENRNINTEFINVDLAGDRASQHIIETVKLVFLDLHYGPSFEASLCAQLVSEIVPTGHQYYLVAWTQDPDRVDEVIEELRRVDLAPLAYVGKHKESYRIGAGSYDIDKLFDELNNELDRTLEVVDFYGRIIEIDEGEVLIHCIMNPDRFNIEQPIYQIRRFDTSPLNGAVNVEVGNYVIVRSITKKGTRIFEFYNGNSSLSKFFVDKKDLFKDIDLSKLFDID